MDQEHIDYKDDDLQPGWPWSIGITAGQTVVYVALALFIVMLSLAYVTARSIDDL
jgi:hypothetical protein